MLPPVDLALGDLFAIRVFDVHATEQAKTQPKMFASAIARS
jgi:hypothetical protein